MEFYRYRDQGGQLDEEQWEAADEGARKCLGESVALTQQSEITLGHADKVKGSSRAHSERPAEAAVV